MDFNTPHVYGYEQYLRTVLDLQLDAPALEQAWLRCAFNVAAVNCDDHTKNFAFILDQTGQWDIAPAYDTCFSHNPAAGKWTRRHQMLVRGKAWDITAEDLIALAEDFDVRKPKELLQRVVDAVTRWPDFAERAGVPRPRSRESKRFSRIGSARYECNLADAPRYRAPARTQRRGDRRLSALMAACNGVTPPASAAFASAPALNNASTAGSCPRSVASINAVRPPHRALQCQACLSGVPCSPATSPASAARRKAAAAS